MNFQTKANKELLFNFFLTFSRFEYALKSSRFFKKPNRNRYNPDKPHVAEPDWESFENSILRVFSWERSEKLKQACEFLLHSPPDKQVIIQDDTDWAIDWRTPVQQSHETDIKFILKMVRSVRNNLFHGGKYNTEDTARTERLLRSSILVLGECLISAEEVRQHFDKAII